MKHCMLAKFKDSVTEEQKTQLINEVFPLFKELEKIDGIEAVKCRRNCIDRANRYDIFIEITMEEAALSVYDESEPHKIWKKNYGEYLENKAIFDYNEEEG